MKKLIGGALVAAAAAVASLTGAGTASAYGMDELVYLQTLNYSGFTIYNTAAAISTGYQICDSFSYQDGNQIARDLFYNTSWSDTPTLASAALIVNAAANTLCPWVWDAAPAVQSDYL